MLGDGTGRAGASSGSRALRFNPAGAGVMVTFPSPWHPRRMTASRDLLFPVSVVVSCLVGCGPPPGEVLADGRVQSVVHDPAQVNAFVVTVGDGEAVLVDAGIDDGAEALRAVLDERGLQVRAILFTHGHADHTAGAAAFPDAALMALEAERELIAGREAPVRPLPRFSGPEETGIEITDPLVDGAGFTIGDTAFEVFALPGHSPGSAAWLAHGVLFLGDAASANNDRVEGAPWIFSEDSAVSDENLAALATRLEPRAAEVTTLAFGHSAALEAGLVPLLDF